MTDEPTNPDMPGPFEADTVLLEQLNDSVRRAAEIVEKGRQAQEERIRQAEEDEAQRREDHEAAMVRQKRDLYTKVGVIVFFAVAFAVGFSLWSKATADEAKGAAADAQEALVIFEREREARTVGSCEAQRAQALGALESDRESIAGLQADVRFWEFALSTADPSSDPTVVQFVEQLRADKVAVIQAIEDSQEPVRICSLEAIDAFFASNGVEGVEPPVDLAP